MSQLKKNTLYNVLLIGSQFVLPLLSFPYLTHVLGPANIGTVNFIDSITMTLVNVSALGIPVYGVREIARAKDDKAELKKVFSELLVLHFLFSLLTGGAYFFAIQLTPQLAAHKSLCYISLAVMFMNIFLVEWYYKGLQKFRYITIRSIINRIIPVALTFVFVRVAADYGTYYFIIAFATLLNVSLNFFQLLFTGTLQLHPLQLKRHLKPLVYMLSSSIAVSVYVYLNSTFLGFMASPEHTGYYTSAVKVTNLSVALITAMGTVLIPQLAGAYQRADFETIQRLTDKSFKYVSLMGLPMVAVLMLYSDAVITTIAGPAFLPASLTVKILGLNILAIGFNNIFGMQILTTLNYERYFFKAVGIGMLVSVVCNLLLIPAFTHNGAAVSSVVTEAAVTAITYCYVVKKVKLVFQWNQFLKNALLCTAAFLVAFGAGSLSGLHSLLSIALTCVAGYVLYVLGLLYILKDDALKGLTGDIAGKYVQVITGRRQKKSAGATAVKQKNLQTTAGIISEGVPV